MVSVVKSTKMVGKKLVKRLGDTQRKQRFRRLVSSKVKGFLLSVVQELTNKLPEMSLARAGKRFRKSRPSDKEKPVELLLEKMKISDNNYCVADLQNVSPQTAAALAGVTSLEFWAEEEELSESDFFQDELGTNLENLTRNLQRTLILERTRAEDVEGVEEDEEGDEDEKNDEEKGDDRNENEDGDGESDDRIVITS